MNARGTEKLVGTAQRMVPGAWLFSSLVVVGDEDRLRPVLAEVYRCLGQDFDEASVGSLSREVPGLDLDAVEAAVTDAWLAGAARRHRSRSTARCGRWPRAWSPSIAWTDAPPRRLQPADDTRGAT